MPGGVFGTIRQKHSATLARSPAFIDRDRNVMAARLQLPKASRESGVFCILAVNLPSFRRHAKKCHDGGGRRDRNPRLVEDGRGDDPGWDEEDRVPWIWGG